VPGEWQDVKLYAGSFEKIDGCEDGCEKRQLGDGRWRFGRDPAAMVVRGEEDEDEDEDEDEGVEEVEGDERSMEFD
jgi:hypothetical protein